MPRRQQRCRREAHKARSLRKWNGKERFLCNSLARQKEDENFVCIRNQTIRCCAVSKSASWIKSSILTPNQMPRTIVCDLCQLFIHFSDEEFFTINCVLTIYFFASELRHILNVTYYEKLQFDSSSKTNSLSWKSMNVFIKHVLILNNHRSQWWSISIH